MVTFADIQSAAAALDGYATRTPLLSSPVLDDRVGGRVFIKPENLQRTGSFKFRGAFNRLSNLSAADRKNGVLAFSSGNHAQGVAAAGQILGIKTTILMPEDAPAVKLAATRSYGATVITYDRYKQDRETVARTLQEETGAILVPPYDDPFIIAGQGTSALEAAQDLKAQNMVPDQVLTCCGGGGLSSGSYLAYRHFFPDIDCYAVEPDAYDDVVQSLKLGRRVEADTSKKSICDALLTPSCGVLPFDIFQTINPVGLSVSDDEAIQAVQFAATQLKLVVEPGGAVALAALLSQKLETRDKVSVIVLSGGNIDPTALSSWLAKI